MSFIFKFSPNILNDVKHILEECHKMGNDYCTIDYICKNCKHSRNEIEDCLDAWPHIFRKSVMKSDNGEDLWMLECKWGSIIDYWKAFRMLNYLKSNG